MEQITELLIKIQDKTQSGALFIRAFADGSGSLRNANNECLKLWGSRYGAEKALTDYLESLAPVETVVLNSDYTAEVTERGIAVGCQKIDFAAFDELVKAVAKVRSTDKFAVGTIHEFGQIPVGTFIQYYGSPAYARKDNSVWLKTGPRHLRQSYDKPMDYDSMSATFRVVAKPEDFS